MLFRRMRAAAALHPPLRSVEIGSFHVKFPLQARLCALSRLIHRLSCLFDDHRIGAGGGQSFAGVSRFASG